MYEKQPHSEKLRLRLRKYGTIIKLEDFRKEYKMPSKKQNDHIILPNATLKRFMNTETQMISVLNLSSPNQCSITRHFTRSFHVEADYYDVDVDKEIKKFETSIGNWNKKISDAIANNDLSKINITELKNFAIQIITLQFHRCVMADPQMREAFITIKRKEYEELLHSNHSYEFSEFVKSFEASSRTPSEFIRFFQKNYLMNGNERIEQSYNKFNAVILSIPQNISASFLLPPQHFVCTDTVARVVLGPKLAIGLYPDNFNSQKLITLSKDDADALIPRAIESALEMSDTAYRQVVGEYAYLSEIKNRINFYSDLIQECSNEKALIIRMQDEMWENSLMEIIIVLKYKKPGYNKIYIEISRESKCNSDKILFGIKKICEYGYDIAVISDNTI